jgi:hypothetical protein
MAGVGDIASQGAGHAGAVDTGLGCLGLVLTTAGEAFDFERARHEHLAPGRITNRQDLLRIAEGACLEARSSRSCVDSIQVLSLPVMAKNRSGVRLRRG